MNTISSGLGTSKRNILAGVTTPEDEDPRMVRSSSGSDFKSEVVESAIGEGTGSNLSKIEMAKWEGVPMSEENGALESAKVASDG